MIGWGVVPILATLLIGCSAQLFPAYDPEPIPFPPGQYERYSAGDATGFGMVDDASVPGPRVTPDQAVRLAGVEVVPEPPEDFVGLMRRAKLDGDGDVTNTAWLVAFPSGPIVAIDDQTGEVVGIACCVDELGEGAP